MYIVIPAHILQISGWFTTVASMITGRLSDYIDGDRVYKQTIPIHTPMQHKNTS